MIALLGGKTCPPHCAAAVVVAYAEKDLAVWAVADWVSVGLYCSFPDFIAFEFAKTGWQ